MLGESIRNQVLHRRKGYLACLDRDPHHSTSLGATIE